MTLADLARQLPNEEEIMELFPLMDSESDRGCAVVAGSFVEAAVYMIVGAKMVEDKDCIDSMFHGSNAPLSTFSAKIKAGLSLGMFGPLTAEKLIMVKDIRNTFAHALRPLDFKNPTVFAECKKLAHFELSFYGDSDNLGRSIYLHVCKTIFYQLFTIAQREGGKEITYMLP